MQPGSREDEEVQVWRAALLQLRVPGPGVAGAPGGVHARVGQAGVCRVWRDGGQAQDVLVPGRALLLPRVPTAGVARPQGGVLLRSAGRGVEGLEEKGVGGRGCFRRFSFLWVVVCFRRVCLVATLLICTDC